jgi:hypothetical protein
MLQIGCRQTNLTLNNSKTEYKIIGSKKRLSQVIADPTINVGNLEIKRVENWA